MILWLLNNFDFQANPEVKQQYAEKAEKDKERYNKEFAEYRLTPEYKKFMEDQEKKEGQPPKKKSKKKEDKKSSQTGATNAAADDASDTKEDPATGLDFPIFTEEFLEFNKNRETELRQLRKQVISKLFKKIAHFGALELLTSTFLHGTLSRGPL